MQITEEEIPDFLNNTEAHRVEKRKKSAQNGAKTLNVE